MYKICNQPQELIQVKEVVTHLWQKLSVASPHLFIQYKIYVSHLEPTEPVSICRSQQRKQLVLLCLVIQHLWLFSTTLWTTLQTLYLITNVHIWKFVHYY